MTRAAAVAGFLLAIVLFWEAVPSGSAWWAAAVLLLVAGAGTLRRLAAAHLVLCGLGLTVLARALPLYFRTHLLWPYLPMIALASLTLGLGLLGFLLDRYRVPEDSGPTL